MSTYGIKAFKGFQMNSSGEMSGSFPPIQYTFSEKSHMRIFWKQNILRKYICCCICILITLIIIGELKSLERFPLDGFSVQVYVAFCHSILWLKGDITLKKRFSDSFVFNESTWVLERQIGSKKKEENSIHPSVPVRPRGKAEQVAKKNWAVYGSNTVSNSTAKRWFQRFRSIIWTSKMKHILVGQWSKMLIKSWESSSQTSGSQKTVWNHL